MAEGKTEKIKNIKVNNKTDTVLAAAKEVTQVVVDNNLVPDFREANPGVKQ